MFYNMAIEAKKRNYFISYIKGWAILSITLVHLIDWSGIELTKTELWWREWLYPGVLFFIAASGAVVYIAYSRYDDLLRPTKRLLSRGLQLVGWFYFYNILKFYLFNFDTQPFFWQFKEKGVFDLFHILTFKSFTAPISIILSIGFFLMLSPLLLWANKKIKYPKVFVGGLILFFILVNYVFNLPVNIVTNWLYAKNNIMFPVILWIVPYLMGFWLAMWGLEKKRFWGLMIFSLLAGIFYFYEKSHGGGWQLTNYMYPLRLYYIFASFAFMYFLFFVFAFLEKIKVGVIKYFLAWLRVMGDFTLPIYLLHWVVVDFTYWYFFPDIKKILITGPLFILLFSLVKIKKIKEYSLL